MIADKNSRIDIARNVLSLHPMVVDLLTPPDLLFAATALGACCGPASFAALFRLPVVRSLFFFHDFPEVRTTSGTAMRRALDAYGAHYEFLSEKRLPDRGLAWIEPTGDWASNGIAGYYRSITRSHWIAKVENRVFDLNQGSWIDVYEWEGHLSDVWLKNIRGARNWRVRASFEVFSR